MAIAQYSYPAVVTTVTNNDHVVVTLPAANTGDLLVLCSEAFGGEGAKVTKPTGWQDLVVPAYPAAADHGSFGVFWKYQAAGDPTVVSVSLRTDWGGYRFGRVIVVPLRFTGVHPTIPFEAHNSLVTVGVTTGVLTKTVVAPSLTAAAAGRYLVCAFGGITTGTDPVTANALRWTPPTGMTEMRDEDTDTAGVYNITESVAYLALPGAGSTGTKTATLTSTAQKIGGWAWGASFLVNPFPPPQPPDAPTNVAVAPLAQGLRVDWAPPVNDGYSPITGYEVKVTPTAGGTTVTQSLTAAMRTVTFNAATGYPLVNGTAYNVTVAAKNVAGTGATAPGSGTPVPDPVKPSVPRNPLLTPGNAQVTLTWSVPASDGGSPITGYRVTLYTPVSTLISDQTVSASTFTHTFTGLNNGQSYFGYAQAINVVGTGTAALAATVKPYTAPSAPTLVNGAPGDQQIVVTWAPPTTAGTGGTTGYRVTTTRVSDGTQVATSDVAPTDRTVPVPGLENGIEYRVDVIALSTYGPGPAATVTATPTPPVPALPGSPVGFTAIDDVTATGTVVVTWQPPADTGGYNITAYRLNVKEPKTGTLIQTKSYGPTVRTDKVTGLANGVPFAFTLVATTAVGSSAGVSATATPHPVPAPPNQVTNLHGVAVDDTTLELAWAPPAIGSEVEHYEVSTVAPTSRTRAAPQVVPAEQTTFTTTRLDPDTPYTYAVRALNLYGSSPPAQTTVSTEPVYEPPVVELPEPVPYAFPQPTDVEPPRIFRPANFGKTVKEVPPGE